MGGRGKYAGRPFTVKCPKCKRGKYGYPPKLDGVHIDRFNQKRKNGKTYTHVHCRDCGHVWWTTLVALNKQALAASPASSEKPSEGYTYPPCPTCGEEIDPVFGRCRQPSHPPPSESGTSPDDAERAALDWARGKCSGGRDRLEDAGCVEDLAALLRARDAATWKRACDELRRKCEVTPNQTLAHWNGELADWLAARGPK